MSDNGGDYVSNEFKNLCAQGDIQQVLAALCNPQQDGVTERKNHSIMGAKRVMLDDQVLPLHLWVEA